MNKDLVRAYLHAQCLGKGKALPSQALEQALNLSGNSLRKQVNRLRQEGVPIASCKRGYFYAETAGEVAATIQELKKMRSGLDAAIAARDLARDGFGRQQ